MPEGTPGGGPTRSGSPGDPWVHLDGRLQRRSEARVSVRDRAFRYGEGLFETMRARGLKAFRFESHLSRLAASARIIGWDLPWERADLTSAVAEVLAANGLVEARVRLQASPGPGGPDGGDGPPTLLVEVEPFVPISSAVRRCGVGVRIAPHRRPRRSATSGAKTVAYLESVLARRAARREGAFEALWLDESDHLCEAAMANVFAVVAGQLRTPPLEGGALAGITRGVVLELARAAGRPEASEAAVPLDDLLAAEEVFLTSTGVEVLPVAAVDGRPVGDGRPGPITRHLARAYRDAVEREIGTCGRHDV